MTTDIVTPIENSEFRVYPIDHPSVQDKILSEGPITVFYHANCMDGFGAAFSVWHRLIKLRASLGTNIRDRVVFKAMQYLKKDEHGNYDTSKFPDSGTYSGRVVFIVDFSFPAEFMSCLLAKSARVYWFDHHAGPCKEILKELGIVDLSKEQKLRHHVRFRNNSEFVLDDGRSGAKIAWEVLHPLGATPALINHLDDYDRWKFKIQHTREVSAALSMEYGAWDFPDWMPLLENLDSTIVEGKILLRSIRASSERIGKQAMRSVMMYTSMNPSEGVLSTSHFVQGLAVNSNVHVNEVAEHLYTANPEVDFVLVWYILANGLVKCSFRNAGSKPISRLLAQEHGGNGHDNSAACEVDLHTLQGWLKP